MTRHSESLAELKRALRRAEESAKKALRESGPIRLEVDSSKVRGDEPEGNEDTLD